MNTLLKRASSLFLLASIPLLLKSQAKVYTFIQENPPNTVGSSVCFQSVIDARPERSDIGLIYSSDRRKKYPAEFRHTLSEEFFEFYKTAYPPGSGQLKLSLLVNKFIIGHEISELGPDQGKVILDAEIYLNRPEGCQMLCHYSDSIVEESKDVRLSHPNRIKRILMKAAQSGEILSKQILSDSSMTTSLVNYEELRKRSTDPQVNNLRKQDSLSQKPDYYFFNTGAYYSFSSEVMLFGITASMVLQIKQHPQYLVGGNFDLLIYGVPTQSVTLSNGEYRIKNYNAGLKIMKQLKDNVFLNVNPQIVMGYLEKLTAPTRKESLLGFEFDLGAYLIPPNEKGVYSGLNLFIRTSNSTFFDTGLGLKLDLGYRF